MRQIKISHSITSRETESLEKYLSDISKIPMITPDEEAELARKIRDGDVIALDKLTKSNLRFVVSVSKQYQGHGLTLSDLINEGNVGLIKAAQKFDETKGFKFISYAVWWIRQSIMIALVEHSRLVRLPLNKASNLSKINKIAAQLAQEYEREPTIEELAETMHLKDSEIQELTQGGSRHLSMDAPIGNESDDMTMADTFASDGSEGPPDNALLNESLKEEIVIALQNLTPRESDIIAAFYGLNGLKQMNLEEIGKNFDLSEERVRQIKERALRRLKRSTTSNMLKDYL